MQTSSSNDTAGKINTELQQQLGLAFVRSHILTQPQALPARVHDRAKHAFQLQALQRSHQQPCLPVSQCWLMSVGCSSLLCHDPPQPSSCVEIMCCAGGPRLPSTNIILASLFGQAGVCSQRVLIVCILWQIWKTCFLCNACSQVCFMELLNLKTGTQESDLTQLSQ